MDPVSLVCGSGERVCHGEGCERCEVSGIRAGDRVEFAMVESTRGAQFLEAVMEVAYCFSKWGFYCCEVVHSGRTSPGVTV